MSRQKKGLTPADKKRQNRRNTIKPIIGHCENDRTAEPRNWLKGKQEDEINVLAWAIGFNLCKALRRLTQHLLSKTTGFHRGP